MKDMTFRNKLFGTFLFIDLMIILIMTSSYTTAKKVITLENAESYVNHYGIFLLVLLIVLLLAMAAFTFNILHTLRLSVDQLKDAGEKISAGEVTNVNLEKKANDEFGELIDTFSNMADMIKEDAMVAAAVADGDLTVAVTPKSSNDLMGNSLKKLVEQNNHALSNIRDAAYQVMTSSSQVASASEALAQGSTEQASALEEITASIDDIAGKTKQNAQEASGAAELMNKAFADVKEGNEQMKQMVEAMHQINDASENISKIIKVIDDIAFQTNILALNAAVEAARAGDAGMGFAVVAEEVRSLAAKSAAAAAETAEMIEDSIAKVQTGTKMADETAKALEVISNIVTESEEIVTGIAQASNYQATAIEQIDQAIEQVSQVVQTNSATSQECAAASVELSGQANRMRELLAVYNLGSDGMAAGFTSGNNYYTKVSNQNEQIISLSDGFGKY